MSVPFKSIRVGPYDVPIVPLIGDDKDKNLGMFYRTDMSIGVQDKYVSPQREAETVLHELFHAIFEIWGIRAKDSEERIVTQMSLGWAQVMRDNPKLIQWMRTKFK